MISREALKREETPKWCVWDVGENPSVCTWVNIQKTYLEISLYMVIPFSRVIEVQQSVFIAAARTPVTVGGRGLPGRSPGREHECPAGLSLVGLEV